MKPLHEAVGLPVVSGRLSVFDGEEPTQAGPQRRGELRASVACNDVWNAESLYPSLEEGRCQSAAGEWDRFRPASRPVYDGKQI